MDNVFTAEIITQDDNDLDSKDYTGLSRDAYDRLYKAISEAGFVLTEINPQEAT